MFWFSNIIGITLLATVLKAPILYRAYPYEEINLSIKMFITLLFALFALLCIIFYFLSVLFRYIFRDELKKRIEEKRKIKFREALSEVERSGALKVKKALGLARTGGEKRSVRYALKRYYKRTFRSSIIPRIAEGGASDVTINKARMFLEEIGIKNEKTEAVLARAIRVGKKIKKIREEDADLFQEQ